MRAFSSASPPAMSAKRAAGDAHLLGGDLVGRHRADSRIVLGHLRRPAGRDLVHPGMPVDHEHPLGTQAARHLGHDGARLGVVDAEQLPRGTGRVRERAEDVEDGANAHLATGSRRVTHARVQRLGEQEADTALIDAARHVLRD